MRRRFLGIGGTLFLLMIALAAIGVGYGLWQKTLTISGTVSTGNVNAGFTQAYTDDDGRVDVSTKDPTDTGDCRIGTSSCDPSGPGPDAPRYDKGVATCVARVEDNGGTVTISIGNGYPSYYCTIWAHIKNTGSIPVRIQSATVTGTNITTELTAGLLSGTACGTQIDPGDEIQVGGWVHVEQSALQSDTYWANLQVQLVQWNEFNGTLCNF